MESRVTGTELEERKVMKVLEWDFGDSNSSAPSFMKVQWITLGHKVVAGQNGMKGCYV